MSKYTIETHLIFIYCNVTNSNTFWSVSKIWFFSTIICKLCVWNVFVWIIVYWMFLCIFFFKSTQIPKYIKCLSLLTDLSPLDNSKKFTFWIHQDLAMQAKLLMQYVWEGSSIWNKYIYFFFNPTYFSLKIQV